MRRGSSRLLRERHSARGIAQIAKVPASDQLGVDGSE
jgi:hypothetical protein